MSSATMINRTPFPKLPRNEPGPDVSVRLPGAAPASQLGRGSQGPEVEALQKNLKALGYPVEVDGKFGPETQAAVEKYQREHGLKPDGIVGPLTHAALDKDVGALIMAPKKVPASPHLDQFEATKR